jgi:hypothetical protein
MEVTGFVVAAIVWVVLFGWLGAWVATQCGRNAGEGFKLGIVFGPLGAIIEALLPRR